MDRMLDKSAKKCCICGKALHGFGHNPEPYADGVHGQRCCDACNTEKVVPSRLEAFKLACQ